MKCTKCGFISFDFNQVCPKCNRGLSDEQRKMNLPAFRPEPPMLLARLLGEAYDDGDVEVMNDQPTTMEAADLMIGSDMDDSLAGLEDDEVSLEGEEKLDVVSLARDKHEPEVKEPVLDLDDISLEEDISPHRVENEEDALGLIIESDDLILDESMIEPSGAGAKGTGIEPGEKEGLRDEDISFNLDDLSFEDLEPGDTGASGLGSNLTDKKAEPTDTPADEFDIFKSTGTMEAFYLDSNAEGLTKEIDMKKFKKDADKGDKKPEQVRGL